MIRRAALLLGALASLAGAQTEGQWEIRPIVGIALPTGALRGAFDNVLFYGAQSSIRVTHDVEILASFAWQPSTAKYDAADRRVNVSVYDAGVERHFRHADTDRVALVPFIGAGIGGRAYDFRSTSLEGSTCMSGYVSAGVAYERRRGAVRLELRDNMLCYRNPLPSFQEGTRNEVALALGAGLRF
jgi:hypothetical protein